ncbi:Aspartyl protease family protein 1 [Camellia lanceoleosa]|uniref:Aspartyl protease family protein 1 n=1 Tax=Camellia lanceoleosa TaxID=1840588 RepID=A0ACC0I588_9ERIC|nr:Aspartyl protease family protein 1 [Camellia lanceoleosa]
MDLVCSGSIYTTDTPIQSTEFSTSVVCRRKAASITTLPWPTAISSFTAASSLQSLLLLLLSSAATILTNSMLSDICFMRMFLWDHRAYGFLWHLTPEATCFGYHVIVSNAYVACRQHLDNCGIVQTGLFLDGAAPNGLFGLGMNNISVPSILANQGLAANSFSMCFGPDGIGRISFGDKGSSEQGETPFNLGQSDPTYNISITQITVDKNVTDLSFTAIFDSGTSFTYLNDPAYSVITEGFNSQAKEKRHPPNSQIPFEYCYDLSANQTTFETASLNLTMKGGKQFLVTHPTEIIDMQDQGYMYCLAVVKSGDINIIGQNFMTGYHIIFDRERMVLGWESSNCYDANN